MIGSDLVLFYISLYCHLYSTPNLPTMINPLWCSRQHICLSFGDIGSIPITLDGVAGASLIDQQKP